MSKMNLQYSRHIRQKRHGSLIYFDLQVTLLLIWAALMCTRFTVFFFWVSRGWLLSRRHMLRLIHATAIPAYALYRLARLFTLHCAHSSLSTWKDGRLCIMVIVTYWTDYLSLATCYAPLLCLYDLTMGHESENTSRRHAFRTHLRPFPPHHLRRCFSCSVDIGSCKNKSISFSKMKQCEEKDARSSLFTTTGCHENRKRNSS